MNDRAKTASAAAAGVAFLATVAILLPHRVILRGDDFGYVESALATLQNGRWTPSEWLEPFNLVLPWLSAGVHHLTKNFWLATFGVSAALAAVNGILLRAWLRPVSAVDEWAVVGVALFPVALNKAVEFTGVPLGVALTLGALLAWRRGARMLFFALVLLGVANRQSAICLLVPPTVEIARTWRRERRFDPWLALGATTVLVVTLAWSRWLPSTFARTVAAARWREEFSIVAFAGNLALGVVMLAAVRAGWSALRGKSLSASWRENLAKPLAPLVLTLAGAWLVFGGAAELRFELPDWIVPARVVVAAATFFGAWFGQWRSRPPIEATALALAYAGLVAWRGQWWDYYFLEPALVLAWPAATAPATEHGASQKLAVATLLAGGLAYAFVFASYLRRTEARIVDYERALRSGAISIVEASDAPFGYLGWKLFATARARGGGHERLADFLKYVEGARATWTPTGLVIDRQGGRRSIHPSREKWPLAADWLDRPLPLTNAEWRELATRRSPASSASAPPRP